MRAFVTGCLAALAVAFSAGVASAQYGGGHGGGHVVVPGHGGGHAPVHYPPTHYPHGGYAVPSGGFGVGVYAGPTYGPPVGVYSGPAVVPAPYYPGYGYGHHRPHHLFHH